MQLGKLDVPVLFAERNELTYIALGTPIPAGMSPEQAAIIQMQQAQAVHPVLPTPEKRWYDRVVDSVLGEDPCKLTVHLRGAKS